MLLLIDPTPRLSPSQAPKAILSSDLPALAFSKSRIELICADNST
jgi:hypothetical protein